MSHILIVPSSEPDAKYRPSGEKTTLVVHKVCPSSSPDVFPSSALIILILPLGIPTAKTVPSGAN